MSAMVPIPARRAVFGEAPRLNAVRTLIALVVAFGYASTMPLGPAHQETLTHFGYGPSWLGVQLLFLFSGALAMRSLEAGRAGWAYLRSRIWRNLPLLIAMTVASIAILFPLFGTPADSGFPLFKRLASYIALTVSCIEPGKPLPGLMDGAKYMCLVQGAIWTLRYGAILHILTAIASKLKLFKSGALMAASTVLTTLIYIGVTRYAVSHDLQNLTAPISGLRLAYPFMIGMCVWRFRARLPQNGFKRICLAVALISLTGFQYTVFPWTPATEVTLTLFWAYLAWLMAFSSTKSLNILNGWPHLALGVYLANWPVSQALLLMNPDLTPQSLPLFSLPITLMIAIVTHFALTGRINAFFKKRLSAKVAVETASS